MSAIQRVVFVHGSHKLRILLLDLRQALRLRSAAVGLALQPRAEAAVVHLKLRGAALAVLAVGRQERRNSRGMYGEMERRAKGQTSVTEKRLKQQNHQKSHVHKQKV